MSSFEHGVNAVDSEVGATPAFNEIQRWEIEELERELGQQALFSLDEVDIWGEQ